MLRASLPVPPGSRPSLALAVVPPVGPLDEIEDGDHSSLVEQAGLPQALNVSTLLLMLAHCVLGGLAADGVLPERVPLFGAGLAVATVQATVGQHLDLAAEGRLDLTMASAFDIARRKAGALAGAACRLGALLGTDDEELLGLYEGFGRHYGTAAQFANDLHDAENSSRKSDADRAKATLPLLYERNTGAWAQGGQGAATSPARRDLAASGALHFAWVACEIERQRAAAVLDRLVARGQDVAPLRGLIE